MGPHIDLSGRDGVNKPASVEAVKGQVNIKILFWNMPFSAQYKIGEWQAA